MQGDILEIAFIDYKISQLDGSNPEIIMLQPMKVRVDRKEKSVKPEFLTKFYFPSDQPLYTKEQPMCGCATQISKEDLFHLTNEAVFGTPQQKLQNVLSAVESSLAIHVTCLDFLFRPMIKNLFKKYKVDYPASFDEKLTSTEDSDNILLLFPEILEKK